MTTAPPTEAELPRMPWRGLAVLAVLVAALHLALLGLLPPAAGPRPSPLAPTFITRSIVVSPPAQPQPAAPASPKAADAAPVPAPAPTPTRPPRPRPAAASAPARAVTAPAAAAPQPQPPANDLIAQSAIDAGAAADAPGDADRGAAAPGADNAAGAGAAAGAGSEAGAGAGSEAAGNLAGPVPLQVPGAVRLGFAATAQQGAQPLQGVFGELVWRQDGNRYDLQLAWTFLFKTLRRQHSVGTIGPGGIEPERFSDTRKREVVSQFDRANRQVVFGSNAPSVMLLAGAQDRLSVVLQLGALLAGDPARYPPGAVIAVQTVGTRDAEIWTFNVEGDEELTVPAGAFQARRLTRNPRKPFDDRIELWLAPALGWLPVRMRQTQPDGDVIDLQLRSQGSPSP